MYWMAFSVSTVIALAYSAICATIVSRVLLQGDQWRTNKLATATAAIFFSCGIGHSLHAVHLLELGHGAVGLYDTHMTLWDASTACVALWYLSLRSRLVGLSSPATLFRDEREAEQQRLAGVLDELFDGVLLVDLSDVGEGDLAAALLAEPGLAPLVDLLGPGAPDAVEALASLCRGSVPGRRLELHGPQASVELGVVPWQDGTVVVTWHDTTTAARTAAQAREAEARLAATFQAAPVPMALVGEGLEHANTALLAMLGGVPLGGWDALFVAEDRPQAQAGLLAALGGHPVPSWDARLQTAGADRWVNVSLAPVGPPGVPAAHAIAHLLDVEDRKRDETRLRHVADHDPLTGLANRRRLDEELVRHCDLFRRHGEPGALLLLDLDHFKAVNDTLGHPVGDELLVSVARLLVAQSRQSDVVARLGGDEFAVLLPHTSRREAQAVAQRVCDLVHERTQRVDPSSPQRRVTASIGVVQFDDVECTPEALVAAADLMLYEAKDAGRGGWAAYGGDRHVVPRARSGQESPEQRRAPVA